MKSSQSNSARLAARAMVALAIAAALPGVAAAGGFAVREQSAEFQGMSFAGAAAAGGGLSGMFWNPAVAAYAPVGIYTESHYSAILADSEIHGDVFAGGASLGLNGNSGDIAKDAIVPASYASMRLSDRLVLAISVNSPFGLVTEPSNRAWAGQTFARTSEIKTYNFAPTLAYRLTPAIAVGVGLQMERIEGRLKSASGITPTSLNLVVEGDDFAFGFTAGVNITPRAGTEIGLGFRSSIDHTLEGHVAVPGSPVGPANLGAAIKAGTTLPEIVTLSIRHAMSPALTLLGTVEWSNWSRLERLRVVCANNGGVGNPVFCPLGDGQVVRSLELGWDDGWFFALGGEYRYSEPLTLRAGLAYEVSPIDRAEARTLRVPDADRLWLSLGGAYKWSESMTFDFAYSHIFVDDGPIDRTESGLRFIGKAESSIDIFAVSLKMKLGGEPASYAPLK
jgi:long-chain fatty acid transport protein